MVVSLCAPGCTMIGRFSPTPNTFLSLLGTVVPGAIVGTVVYWRWGGCGYRDCVSAAMPTSAAAENIASAEGMALFIGFLHVLNVTSHAPAAEGREVAGMRLQRIRTLRPSAS